VKIFLWANLEKKVKIEKFRQNDGKRVFKKKKEEKAFEENLNFIIATVAYYCRLMSLRKG